MNAALNALLLRHRTALSVLLAVAGFTVLTAAPPDGPPASHPPFAGAVAPSGDVVAGPAGDSEGSVSPDA